ncbi:unnamed protein product [Larinioides sclopetarius]|uniref:Uncharacterized protein n=1 Tax=Larinioides sclopetarius TaxID=280406 RepID=A0AAV2BRZ5_9ARAC
MAAPTAPFVLFLLISVVASKTLPGKENTIVELFDDKAERGPRVKEDVTWPGFPYLKQVSAVSVDSNGNLHLFHRGDRVWDAHTFDRTYRLVDTEQGPIPNDTVLVINTSNGKILYSWGANRRHAGAAQPDAGPQAPRRVRGRPGERTGPLLLDGGGRQRARRDACHHREPGPRQSLRHRHQGSATVPSERTRFMAQPVGLR